MPPQRIEFLQTKFVKCKNCKFWHNKFDMLNFLCQFRLISQCIIKISAGKGSAAKRGEGGRTKIEGDNSIAKKGVGSATLKYICSRFLLSQSAQRHFENTGVQVQLPFKQEQRFVFIHFCSRCNRPLYDSNIQWCVKNYDIHFCGQTDLDLT